MSYTKRQIVDEAYAELALAGFVFDLQPEEMQWGLRRLDLMMATWTARGINIGYQHSDLNESDLDQDSGLPAIFIEAACLGLAKSLAAGKGKALTASTLERTNDAMRALQQSLALASLKQQQTPGWIPRGAGAKANRGLMNDTFFPEPASGPVQGTDDGELNLGT